MRTQAERARSAWRVLSVADTGVKNAALLRVPHEIEARIERILEANRRDVESAHKNGSADAFIERLTMNEKRIAKMTAGIHEVIALDDPVGKVISDMTQKDGLHIVKRRVPLGVIAIIYESRPDVTVDASALCVKSGNAVILRGGSEAFLTNEVLTEAVRAALGHAGLPQDCVSMVADTSRDTAAELMAMNEYVDVLIPRGGKGLIDYVVRNSTIPVIQTGDGICHVYVDGICDMDMARKIAVSAKISRPSVCNAAETLLVDAAIAERFLPGCLAELRERNVELRGCATAKRLCPWIKEASERDYYTEYLDYIYNVKVVNGLDAAIEHINAHGTRHSEAIVTSDARRGRRFQGLVDAAAVYVNASTRFTDGNVFGLGAERGVSNQKLHARGPMGLNELTTYKYEITGDGHIR